MANLRWRHTLTIREIEGTRRWAATLNGRGRPHKSEAPEFGVLPKSEVTAYRGNAENKVEPISLEYPELTFSGRWDLLHFMSGDTWFDLSVDHDQSTPQHVCDFFELFASRNKVVEVTWSSGITRIATWAGFTYKLGRNEERHWTMKFKVLARQRVEPQESASPLTSKGALASLQNGALSLDAMLNTYPPGLAPSFLDQLKEKFGAARAKLAEVRAKVAGVAELARAPADVLNEITMVGETARDTLVGAIDSFESTAYEYQVQVHRAENLQSLRAYRAKVEEATAIIFDALFAMLDFIDSLTTKPLRYVNVAPGQSLARLSLLEYGSPEFWQKIAAANNINGQTVPAGVSRLIVPEV